MPGNIFLPFAIGGAVLGFILLCFWMDDERRRARLAAFIKAWFRTIVGTAAIGTLLLWHWPDLRKTPNRSSFPVAAYASDRQYDGDRVIADSIVMAAAILAIAILFKKPSSATADPPMGKIVKIPEPPPQS